jgi:succinate dehydrogenase flavin-adding protein (antitoxin of CptAB toxin-antitoxin module)
MEYGENTSWSIHTLEDWSTYTPFRIEGKNEYYKKILEITEAAAADGRDKYLVGVTDIHAGADCLVAMRGPETLCIDTIERPDFIKRGVMDLFEGFKTFYTELADITCRHQEGTTNWMGIWHPGRWYVSSCDFICLISEESFEDLIVEELEAELDFLDASIFHLDGPGALRHLDRLLEIKKLKGVQWVYGAGQPTASHWLPVLKKIQAAGKCFQVLATPEEMPVLLENLAPEGAMYIVVGISSESQARDLEALITHGD